MKAFAVNRIDIGVYSIQEDVHDFITRRRFAPTHHGRNRTAHYREIPVRINCSVMNINLSDYKELYQYFMAWGWMYPSMVRFEERITRVLKPMPLDSLSLKSELEEFKGNSWAVRSRRLKWTRMNLLGRKDIGSYSAGWDRHPLRGVANAPGKCSGAISPDHMDAAACSERDS